MQKNYWLHRISYEWELSYPLLEKGYLSYGWNCYVKTKLLEETAKNGWTYFAKFMENNNNSSRSRYSLWRFLNFKKGDIVLVPLFGGNFCICQIDGDVTEVTKLGEAFSEITTETKGKALLTPEGYICAETERVYDVGYVVPIKKITEKIPRSFADAKLISRMKIRPTNADINDLAASVDMAMKATTPVNVYDKIVQATIAPLSNVFEEYVTPDNLEHIVKNYMMKKGADRVWIPAKNEKNKENGADADVVAEFYDLRLVFFIQVKKHVGNTDDWAVKQIAEYCEQRQETSNEYTYIPWAISTAEFSKDAVRLAEEKGVRLIGGRELIEMLINSGISNIACD